VSIFFRYPWRPMAPKNKLDKFFASKDKKKQKDTGKNEQDVNEADAELAKEVDVDFGITAEFTGRTLKLTKAGAITTDDAFLVPQEAEPAKSWMGKEEAAKEAEHAAAEAAERKAKEEEEKKSQPKKFIPGQGALRRSKGETVTIGEEEFPALGDSTKFKSPDEYQKSLQKSTPGTSTSGPAKASPVNAWSRQMNAADASSGGGAYKPPGTAKPAGQSYQPPGGGLFKK